MGFIESFIAWLVVTFIIAIILYVVFVYILGWLYPQVEDNILQPQTQNNEEIVVEEEPDLKKKQQHIIAIFIFVVMMILIAGSGISAYMDTRTNN